MMNRNWLAAIAMGTALVISANLYAKDPAPDAADKTEAPAKTDKEAKLKADKPVDNDLELDDSYQKIADLAGLKGTKLDDFKEAVKKGQEKIDAWKEGKEGQQLVDLRKQLTAARKEKDESKIKDLESQIEPLNTKANELRNGARAKVLGNLTEKEQSNVVSGSLNARLLKVFDGIKLTEEQQTKIHDLAKSKTEAYLKEHPLSDDPYMRHLIGLQSTLAKQIKADVLTDEQRKEMEADKPVKEKPVKEDKVTKEEKPAKAKD